jgi:hypothetical protein
LTRNIIPITAPINKKKPMFASIGAAGGHLPLLQAELPEQKGKPGQLLGFPPCNT